MADHANAATVRRGYEAFGKGDMETLGELLADTVWHVPGRSQLAGDYKGFAEIGGQFFTRLGELSGGTFSVELHDVLGNDEHVTSIHVGRGDRNGKHLESRGVLVWHFENGKAVEVWDMFYDQYAEDDFWA